jgi:hypothetical protein
MTVIYSHVATVMGRAGRSMLRQHAGCTFDNGTTLVLASAFAVPRLWGFALDAALSGFREGLSRAHDGTTTSRLHQALEEARKRLRSRVEMLLDRQPPDVGLLALSVDDARLHVLSCGPGRVFVRHRQRMRRLTPREDLAEGLLRATPAWCVEPVEPGDLVFAGSLSACSEASLQSLSQRLSQQPEATPEEVVALLNTDAAQLQIGAGALAMRIEERLTVI